MKKILFIDTDLGGDCDDVGAIALANILKNKGVIEIAGITHTTSLPWGAACIDIINNYYGNKNIKIGVTDRTNFLLENTNKYAEKMATTFNPSHLKKEEYPNAIKLIRQTLAGNEDGSITFVCIGQLNNVSDLLDSLPDEISPLNGVELVSKKIKEFVIMGGLFKENKEKIFFGNEEYKAEYNIVCDISSAINFINKVPVKVIFSDFLVGYQIHTASNLLKEMNMKNPITFSYYHFQNMPRESWDLLTIYYASLGEDDMFKISSEGSVNIDKYGNTTFNHSKYRNHYYLRLNNSINYIEQKIDNLLWEGR